MQGEAADVGFAPGARHRPVHGLDDVAANAEIAQGRLQTRLQCPASSPDPLGQPEAFELRGAAQHQAAKLRVLVPTAWAEIDDATALVERIAERPVKAGPALCFDLLLQ